MPFRQFNNDSWLCIEAEVSFIEELVNFCQALLTVNFTRRHIQIDSSLGSNICESSKKTSIVLSDSKDRKLGKNVSLVKFFLQNFRQISCLLRNIIQSISQEHYMKLLNVSTLDY